MDKCLLYLDLSLRSVLSAMRVTVERGVWESCLEPCVDWLRVFVVTCMSDSADLSTITCAWSLVKARGLDQLLKTLDEKYVDNIDMVCRGYSSDTIKFL